MLKKVSSLSQYQHLIVVQSIVGLLSIVSRLILNQKHRQNFSVILSSFFTIYSKHFRPQRIKKFYIGFTPFALAYAICYGVLRTKSSEKELPESIMEILLVPLIVAVSMVCYALISRHFRRVTGYTEKVKQMQARLSTSIYFQGVIHSVLGVVVALIIPLNLLVAELTDDEGIILRFALFYGLFHIMQPVFTDTGANIFYGVQTFNSIASTACGLTIHGYILYKMLKKNSTLSQYQDLIVLQSIVGLISIISRLILNQIVTVDGSTSIFFPFIDFHPILQKAIIFLVTTSESAEEFLIIAFNIHRVLIFLRPYWIKKFYICFTPLAISYSTCYGVLMMKATEKQLLETLMEMLLVPVIIVVSIVCYVLITRYFRSVSGYTEKVKQMQARLSTSIYLQIGAQVTCRSNPANV
ncbi:hypothetical protein Y032_0046g1303 [Ancylostoma ceylanicum]|uniref:Uncharacterized protein n=1 Tax=Ancylostoma ceylanicum TaxID=53326 RepID=A0A016UCL6_9BILA|nr:hypothetical protein Y032_0046g1303 [Ancylostoma ceylanicum]